jgi:hypothetical protein
LLDTVSPPAIEKRLHTWRQDVAQALRDLEATPQDVINASTDNYTHRTRFVSADAVPLTASFATDIHTFPDSHAGNSYVIHSWLQSRSWELGRNERVELYGKDYHLVTYAINFRLELPGRWDRWPLRSCDRELRLVMRRPSYVVLERLLLNPDDFSFDNKLTLHATFLGKLTRKKDSGIFQGLYFHFHALVNGDRNDA